MNINSPIRAGMITALYLFLLTSAVPAPTGLLERNMPYSPLITPTLNWNSFLGGGASDRGRGVAVDASGNAYVTGYSATTWQGTISVPPVRPYTGGNDAYAAKLSVGGALSWNTFLGGGGDDLGAAIAEDGTGNSHVAGQSTTTWGNPVDPFAGGLKDAFVAQVGPTGALAWNAFLGGAGTDRATAIALDSSGNTFVAGASDATWGTPVRPYSGGNDAFAGKMNPSGILDWNTFLGGSGDDVVNAIAFDASGKVYLAGSSTATWGTPFRAYTSGSDAFAARLNSGGALDWNGFLGSSGEDYGNGISVDGTGNLYAVGGSSVGWGTPLYTYTGAANNAFVARISTENSLFLPLIAR